MNKFEVPIWEKVTLTVDEAAAYSNVGTRKIRSMLTAPGCPFVLFIGNHYLVKRKEFEKYLIANSSI